MARYNMECEGHVRLHTCQEGIALAYLLNFKAIEIVYTVLEIKVQVTIKLEAEYIPLVEFVGQ